MRRTLLATGLCMLLLLTGCVSAMKYRELEQYAREQERARQTYRPVQQAPAPAPARVAPVVREEPVVGAIGRRWAVVIGVSKYQSAGAGLPNLRYADRDATTFRDFLMSEAGGAFDSSRVQLLVNEHATTQNIKKALFTFLKGTVKEDFVIIFFSGHGAPDPDKRENLYLLTYDTDPQDISGTGFAMWDLDAALKRNIEAQRVVVLADACHSAGLGSGVGDKGVTLGRQNEINTYLKKLAETKPGRVIFTSSDGYEVSQESEKWGGGHGVFTWALLEGMKGKADGFGGAVDDGIVTLGELIDYVDQTVRRETKNSQHPNKTGSRYDRSLPMGVVKRFIP